MIMTSRKSRGSSSLKEANKFWLKYRTGTLKFFCQTDF